MPATSLVNLCRNHEQFKTKCDRKYRAISVFNGKKLVPEYHKYITVLFAFSKS